MQGAVQFQQGRSFADSGRMAEQPIVRFAVGIFDTREGAAEGLRDLRLRGADLRAVSVIALERVFAHKAFAEVEQSAPAPLCTLAFPRNRAPICCTSGLLADCLAARQRLGASTLQQALGRWLVPRHAAHLGQAVDNGRILVWVQLFDADDERRACQSLLAHSSNSVGVHDLSFDSAFVGK